MVLDRREFCKITAKTLGLVGIAKVLGPGVLRAEQPPSATRGTIIQNSERGLSALVEAADEYISKCLPGQKDPRKTTILYPGSGWDLSPFELGLHVLHRTDVERVHYIHTEIGDYDHAAFGQAWPEGLADLQQKTEEELEKLVQQGLLSNMRRTIRSEGQWIRKDIPSAIIEYEFDVKITIGTKKLLLSVGYNTFENRQEPTEEEKRTFSPELIEKSRGTYWPKETEPGKPYPTYFNQDQFDQADVILSKQAGDFALLQFDCVRALTNIQERKQRALLTEHPDRSHRIKDSLPQYNFEISVLENNDYGYCSHFEGECKVGLVKITPK